MEARDYKLNTPIHIACKGNIAVVKYLVEQGADIEARDYEDNTPVDIAYITKNEGIETHVDVAEYFQNKGYAV